MSKRKCIVKRVLRNLVEDFDPGPPDYKSSALPLGHARLPRNMIIFTLHLYLLPYHVNSNDSQILSALSLWKTPPPSQMFHSQADLRLPAYDFSPFAFFHIRSSEPHCDCRLYTFLRVGLITKSFPQIVSSTHILVPLLPSTNGSSLFLYNDVFQ